MADISLRLTVSDDGSLVFENFTKAVGKGLDALGAKASDASKLVEALDSKLKSAADAIKDVDSGFLKASIIVTGFNQGLELLGKGFSIVTTAIDLSLTSLTKFVEFTVDSSVKIIKLTEGFENFGKILEDKFGKKRGDELAAFVKQVAISSPLLEQDIRQIVQSLALVPSISTQLQTFDLSRVRKELGSTVDAIQALSLFRPDQGFQSALYAFREFIQGSDRSLRFRFDIDPNDILENLGFNLAKVKSDSDEARKAFEAIANSLISPEAMAKLAKAPSRMVSAIGEVFESFFIQVGRAGFYDKVTGFLSGLFDEIQSLTSSPRIAATTKIISDSLSSIFDAVVEISGKIGNSFANLFVSQEDKSLPLLEKIVKTIEVIFQKIDQGLPKIIAWASDAASKVASWMSEIKMDDISTFLDDVYGSVKGIFEFIRDLISELRPFLKEALEFAKAHPLLATGAALAAPSLVSGGLSAAGSFAGGLAANAVTGLSGPAAKLLSTPIGSLAGRTAASAAPLAAEGATAAATAIGNWTSAGLAATGGASAATVVSSSVLVPIVAAVLGALAIIGGFQVGKLLSNIFGFDVESLKKENDARAQKESQYLSDLRLPANASLEDQQSALSSIAKKLADLQVYQDQLLRNKAPEFKEAPQNPLLSAEGVATLGLNLTSELKALNSNLTGVNRPLATIISETNTQKDSRLATKDQLAEAGVPVGYLEDLNSVTSLMKQLEKNRDAIAAQIEATRKLTEAKEAEASASDVLRKAKEAEAMKLREINEVKAFERTAVNQFRDGFIEEFLPGATTTSASGRGRKAVQFNAENFNRLLEQGAEQKFEELEKLLTTQTKTKSGFDIPDSIKKRIREQAGALYEAAETNAVSSFFEGFAASLEKSAGPNATANLLQKNQRTLSNIFTKTNEALRPQDIDDLLKANMVQKDIMSTFWDRQDAVVSSLQTQSDVRTRLLERLKKDRDALAKLVGPTNEQVLAINAEIDLQETSLAGISDRLNTGRSDQEMRFGRGGTLRGNLRAGKLGYKQAVSQFEEESSTVIADFTRDATVNLRDSLSNAIVDGIKTGGKNAKEIFNGFVQGLEDALLQMATRMIANQIVTSVIGAAGSIFGSLGGGASASFSGVGNAGINVAANGAVWPGGFAPVASFANGSPFVDRPTLGLIGEGAQSEAIVPLTHGRTIPVEVRNVSQNSSEGKEKETNVTIINSTDPEYIRAQVAANNGELILNIVGSQPEKFRRVLGISR